MEQNPPQIVVTRRTEPRRAVTTWSLQTLTLEIHFQEMGEQKPGPKTLSEQLDIRMGPRQLDYRLILGPVDILMEAGNRIKSIDVFTNIDQWRRAPLPPPSGPLEPVWAAFEAEYDDNRIASRDLPVSIIWDSAGKQLALRMGTEILPVHWYSVADKVLFGTDERNVLREIRCSDVILQAGIERGGASA